MEKQVSQGQGQEMNKRSLEHLVKSESKGAIIFYRDSGANIKMCPRTKGDNVGFDRLKRFKDVYLDEFIMTTLKIKLIGCFGEC